MEDKFWKITFAKLEKEIKQILEDNKEIIIAKNRHFISIHETLAEFLHIDNKYIEDNNFSNIIFITK